MLICFKKNILFDFLMKLMDISDKIEDMIGE
jgi:hypothetical protein